MIYWHIQMWYPQGPKHPSIDSIKMLQEEVPIIGTGEWDSHQSYYFTGEDERGIKIGDIVLVREGEKPIALCLVVSDYYTDESLTQKYLHEQFRKVKVLKWCSPNQRFPKPQGTLERLVNSNTGSWKFIDSIYRNYLQTNAMQKYIDLLLNKKQIILQGPPGTGKTYTAKDMAEQIIFGEVSDDKRKQMKKLEETDRFKLVQFHPSYSYEDFVRGISAKSNGTNIEYISENKPFAEFAHVAYQNWKEADNPEAVSQETWLKDTIEDFKEYLLNSLDSIESRIKLTPKVYISRVTDSSIRFNSDSWEVDGGVPITDLIKMFNSNVKTRKEVKELNTLTKTAKGTSSYWIKVLELFYKYINDNQLAPVSSPTIAEEKKYVLIIDEINRANLPSVLGELIYALEYRGEAVDSMYATENDFQLIIPNNLLIIGTMNTADRSVGHIDYAIRRRFAFVNILPNESVLLNDKAKQLYSSVSELFTDEYRAPDFDRDDVQLGHSYFIVKDETELMLRLAYEIIPILKEYLKDGILLDKAKDKIIELERLEL